MRPTRRLLALVVLTTIVTALAVAWGDNAREAALWIWPVLFGLMVIDLALSRRGGLQLDVEAPREVFTNEDAHLRLVAPAGAPGRMDIRLDWPAGLRGPSEQTLEGAATIPFRAARRGVWRLDAVWLRWPSRFKLLEFIPKAPLDLTISVVPNIRPVRSGAIDVLVRSTLFGIKDVMFKGEGSDFHQLREFTAGMDPSSIDWKRSARQRKLLGKEMRAEQNHHVILAIDTGYLMREEIAGVARLDHAINAALATGWAAVVGGDLIGLFAYDSRPHLFAPPAAGRGAFAQLRSRTAALEYRSVESNPTLAMAELSARTPRRSLLIVFTEFVDTTTAELLVENLAMLSRRHVVIFVALRDPMLEDRVLKGAETMSEVAESVAAGQMQRERTEVLGRLTRLGVTVVDTAPGDLTPRLVSAYLDLKKREAI